MKRRTGRGFYEGEVGLRRRKRGMNSRMTGRGRGSLTGEEREQFKNKRKRNSLGREGGRKGREGGRGRGKEGGKGGGREGRREKYNYTRNRTMTEWCCKVVRGNSVVLLCGLPRVQVTVFPAFFQ